MKPWPLLVVGLVALLPSSCQKGRFEEERSAGETYEITVVDPKGADATGTPTTTVENTTDGKESGSDTDDDVTKGNTDDDVTKGSGKGNGKGKDPDKIKGNDQATDADAGDCAANAGINKERVKVSGSQKSITLTPQDAFALKVTGNRNLVNLKMTADAPGARLSAICLFVTGNQGHVTMDVGVTVGKIFIKARGNQALVEAAVSKDGVIEDLQVDANGNQPGIVLTGEGTYPCNHTSVSCVKP
ncbi:hypothetical protein [Oligoflexus tunisiensis]|uniref:hypothetical protein n=1 Tax=Oligoflexus tunisiensis TaxID=708132 RepID=UPI00114D243F|nr:hypothetical protein [Oligoflexus tunisiensis]